MSRNFDMIAAINDSKETFKIAVRIVDLWSVQTREKLKHIEMVLMDGKGDRIHAIVKKEDSETWAAKLEEDNTYYMYNFKVVPNDGQYKVCPHPFKLIFTGGTTLRQVNVPDIPLKSYQFKSFKDIISGDYDPDMLFDLIAIVEEVKYQLFNGNPPKVVFFLRDPSSHVISCTLWGDHATKFMGWLKDKTDLVSMIILLTQAKLKPPQGVHGLSISNSLYGSKLLINDEVPDFAIYRERLAVADSGQPSNASQSLSLGQQSQGSEYSDLDRFLYKATVVGLSEISELSDGLIFCTVGTTSKLIAGKGGWFYSSCARCTKKAEHEDQPYTWSCGQFNENCVPRYRVEIMVSHNKAHGNFVFWDRDCADVVGMTALALRTLMIKSGEGDPKHFPDPLDKMLGITLAIKCKYQRKYNTCSVMKMSDDPSIIKAVADQMSTDQQCAAKISNSSLSKTQTAEPSSSKIKDATHVVNKPSTSETQPPEPVSSQMEAVAHDDNASLSATADNDPDQEVLHTPTKRSSSDLSPDDPSSAHAAPTQLSATKIPKHIKHE